MTADPSRSPERPPAWWIATDQGVVLGGPFDDWPVALVGHARAIARLREALERDRRTEPFIAARCAAVAPRWGELSGAWQHFRPRLGRAEELTPTIEVQAAAVRPKYAAEIIRVRGAPVAREPDGLEF